MKLVDDDAELKDKVGDTNKDPYADSTANNEAENINTKTLKKGDKFVSKYGSTQLTSLTLTISNL